MRNALVLLQHSPAVSARLVEDGFSLVEPGVTSPLTVLVCELVSPAAGIFAGTDPAEWLRAVSESVAAPFQRARACLPRLRLGSVAYGAGAGARIIFVFDGWRAASGAESTASAAANGAIVALVKTLARDLGDDGITVNAIARTPDEAFGSQNAALARAVGYLASPLAGTVTGQILTLGSGGEIRP